MQIPQQPISIRIPGAGTIRVANDAAGPDAMECVRWDPGTELDEPFAIRDGRVAYLRSITPAARPLIKAAMKKLSPETSRRRFFTVRHELSEAELDRMTNLDGWNQYAIGAVSVDADGCTEGVGVARWARDADDPRSADFALLVVDGWQHQGRQCASSAAGGDCRFARHRALRRFRAVRQHADVRADRAPRAACGADAWPRLRHCGIHARIARDPLRCVTRGTPGV